MKQIAKLNTVLATLALLLFGAKGALAQEHKFHSDATTVLASVQGNHYPRVGSGQATGLGSFTEVNDYKAKGVDFYGTGTLTGTDGDSLVIAWVNSPVGGDSYEGPYQITGGTGRFANATGAGTLRSDPNPDGTRHQVIDGTISF